jgi:hypothetical protein
MHTWFRSSKRLWDEHEEVNKILDRHNSGEEWRIDVDELEYRSQELYDKMNTEFHDVFTTIKRENDGTYCEDSIFSEKEMWEWLEENDHMVYYHNDKSRLRLKAFWKKYPDGVIEFG